MDVKNEQRERTQKAVADASAVWAKAPAHIKAMAGAYVGPLIEAVWQINHELESIKNGNKK